MGFSFIFIRENYTLLYETITNVIFKEETIMLQTKTNEMINQMDELMEGYKTMMDFDTVMNMDPKTFELMQKTMSLYETSCSLVREQAKIIDSLDKKTNELLEMNRKLLARTKGL